MPDRTPEVGPGTKPCWAGREEMRVPAPEEATRRPWAVNQVHDGA